MIGYDLFNVKLFSNVSANETAACGRVVSASDSQSCGPGFESRSGHLLDLCSVVPSSKFSATLVNSQLVAFCQLGFLILLCLFELFVSKYLSGVPVN